MIASGIYLLLGSAAGLLAGLLGVGGGLIIVPVLAWQFARQGFPPAVIMQVALATSLATIVPTSLSSLRAHHKRGAVRWPLFAQLAPGIVLGALAGAAIADRLPSRSLQIFFGLFELGVAAQLLLDLQPRQRDARRGRFAQFFAGGGIGLISAIVGIGGGTLTVPWLIWNGVVVREAVATASACGLPIALAGATGFALLGGGAGIPASSGYIYWPAFALIALASVMFAPLGAALAHRLDGRHLKRLFALFLGIVGFLMLRRNFA